MNEIFSAWVDGEPCGRCASVSACTCFSILTEGMRADAVARNDWFLAQLIGDALRGRPVLDDGFSLRIISRIEAVQVEPDYDPLASES